MRGDFLKGTRLHVEYAEPGSIGLLWVDQECSAAFAVQGQALLEFSLITTTSIPGMRNATPRAFSRREGPEAHGAVNRSREERRFVSERIFTRSSS
jgi:hypothetical protein